MKHTWLATGIFFSCCCLAALTQPQTASAQRPAGRPAPGERLERLKELGGGLLDSIGGALPNLLPPAGPTEPLEPSKLNGVFQTLLAPIVSGDASIESLYFGFDPLETNLAEDRLGLQLSAILRRSAWSSQRSELHVHVTVRVDQTAEGQPKAVFNVQVHGTSDMIALANYGLPKLREQMRPPLVLPPTEEPLLVEHPAPAVNQVSQVLPPEQRHLPLPPAVVEPQPQALPAPALPQVPQAFVWQGERTLQNRIWERLARTQGIYTLDEIGDLVLHASSLNFLNTNEEIEFLTASLPLTPPEQREELLQKLTLARQKRDKLTSSKLVIWRDPNGQADRITLVSNDTEANGGLKVERLEAVLTPVHFEAKVNAGLTKGVDLYLAFKPLIFGVLGRLQRRDGPTLDIHRGMIDQYYRQGRPYIFGEGP